MAVIELRVTVPEGMVLDGYRCDDPVAHLREVHDPNEGGFTIGNDTDRRWARIEWRPEPACHRCYPVLRFEKECT